MKTIGYVKYPDGYILYGDGTSKIITGKILTGYNRGKLIYNKQLIIFEEEKTGIIHVVNKDIFYS